MVVKVTGLASINKKLDSLAKVEPSIFDKVGAYALQAITDRTHSGKDVDGKSFKPYTHDYLRNRTYAGRSGKVDLNFKGNMLAAMKYRNTGKSVILYFNAKDEMLKAHGHHFGNPKKGLPRRRFFGLSRKERKHIIEMIKNA